MADQTAPEESAEGENTSNFRRKSSARRSRISRNGMIIPVSETDGTSSSLLSQAEQAAKRATKRQRAVDELLETERNYVKDLQDVYWGYEQAIPIEACLLANKSVFSFFKSHSHAQIINGNLV